MPSWLSVALLTILFQSPALATSIPDRMTLALPSKVGEGSFAAMQRFGAEAVTIDIGCALRASAVSSGFYVNDRDRAIMAETDGQPLAAFRLHDLLDDHGSNLIYIPVSNAAYWTSYQHFQKFELESNHPLTEAGASVGYNVRDVGVVLVANNGETHNESPSDWTDAVASRCIRSSKETSDSDVYGGFVMFRYAPDYTPNTARIMQDKRVGALLTIRALVTDLERQTGHEPNAVLVKAAKNLHTQLELSALPENADLTKLGKISTPISTRLSRGSDTTKPMRRSFLRDRSALQPEL